MTQQLVYQGTPKDDFVRKFPKVFFGEVCLMEEGPPLLLTVSETTKPMQASARRVPVVLKEQLHGELMRREKLGAISRAEGPADCLSPMVVTHKKNGKLRVCMDPKNLANTFRGCCIQCQQ